MKNKLFLGLAVAMMTVVTSCGKMPQANIDATKAAIESAQVAQADIYVPAEFTALQDSMNVIMQAVEAENSKMFKNFDASVAKLDALKVQAETLVASVADRKAAVKQEVETAISNAKVALEELKAASTKAMKKLSKEMKEQATANITSIETEISAQEASLAGEVNYVQLLDKINALQQAINGIGAELADGTVATK